MPYAPIFPSYSTFSTDHARLRHIINLLTPGLVFAAYGTRFAGAIEAVVPPDAEVVVTENPQRGRETTLFAALTETSESAAVDATHAVVGLDTIAKFLFTSGSTGLPKGVINTQRVLTSNQVMLNTVLAFLKGEPLVIVDWLPWNHTFGGNHNVGLVLFNGGTALYRRRQADARRHRGNSPQPARDLAPRSISTCRRATRRWCRTWRRSRI